MRRAALVLALAGVLGAPGSALAADAVEIAPDGKRLYGSGGGVSFARDPVSGALGPAEREPGGGGDGAIAISPDGRFAYSATGTGLVVFERRNGGEFLVTRHVYPSGSDAPFPLDGVTALLMTRDGRHLYATVAGDDALVVLERDAEGGGLRAVQALFLDVDGVRGLDGPVVLTAPADESFLYTGAWDGIGAFRRDAATGRLQQVQFVGDDYGNGDGALVAPDGRRLYATSATGKITTFDRDPASGRITPRSETAFAVPGEFPRVAAVAIAPDSGSVLLAARDHGVLIQAATTPDGLREIARFVEDQDGVRGVAGATSYAWSPDGAMLYTGGRQPITAPVAEIGHGRYAAFRRDPGTGVLSFAGFVAATRVQPEGHGSLTIDRGAPATNAHAVRLDVVEPGYGGHLIQIAGDDSFAGAITRRLPRDGVAEWALAPALRPERTVREVFVRFSENGVEWHSVLSDDIVLDQRAPTILSARLRASRARGYVALAARDRGSGVKRVQVTRSKRRPGAVRRFARRIALRSRPRKVFVRLRDGAGNWTSWRTVRRR